MTEFNWTPYLRGGGTRPDAISGLQEGMRNSLAKFLLEAPDGLTINSAYRSPELQAQLYENALARYGSEEEARRWVAPPGRSQHNHGFAVDLGFANDAARAWAHENAARFGMAFPLDNENWHMEMAGARDGPQPASPRPEGNALAAYDRAPVLPRRQVQTAMLDPRDFMSTPYQGGATDYTARRGYLRY